MRYRILSRTKKVGNEERKDKVLLRDDGYRVHAKYIETFLINAESGWIFLFEYKHGDNPFLAESVLDLIFDREESAKWVRTFPVDEKDIKEFL